MRTYVNNDIYNALPSVIKNAIINTTVVSGHGRLDTNNFTSVDKIYLLATHEVWEDVDGDTSDGIDYYDTAYHNTRQLDYYRELNVTTSNYSGAIKRNGAAVAAYWFRSSYSTSSTSFFNTTDYGDWYYSNSSGFGGISPAFRIG